MVQKIKDGRIEQYDKAMPESHWLRNKKQVVDLLRDTPFATSRQLEDQRRSMERNRNPQLYNPTKADKVRSELIVAKKGVSRPVAVKANVLNKIVREASGVHNYTIVAPPRMKGSPEKINTECLDADTNPRMKSYAAEAKLKPTVCSFGHRPSSASRTFHPATMKFRLKHGEIASDNNKTGFGLPVAILKQVLYAPKITAPGTSDDEEAFDAMHGSERSPSKARGGGANKDYSDLFFSQDEQSQLFSATGDSVSYHHQQQQQRQRQQQRHQAGEQSKLRHRGGEQFRSGEWNNNNEEDINSLSKASWVSGDTTAAAAMLLQRRQDSKNPKLVPLLNTNASSNGSPGTGGIDRPVWDEAHHRISQSSSEKFALRMSGLNDLAQQPLSEKLKRFAQLAVAESQIVPFCVKKQETDRLIRSGAAHQVPRAKGTKQHPLYTDPWDVELALVKRYHRQLERRAEGRRSAASYQDALSTVPQVDYYPTTELSRMNSSSNNRQQLQKEGKNKGDIQRRGEGGGEASPSLSSSMVSLQGSHQTQTQSQTAVSATSISAVDRPQNLLNFSYPMQFQQPSSSSSSSQVSATHQAQRPIYGSDDNGGVGENAALGGEGHNSVADMERRAKAAMRAAKRGDTTALYDLHIGSKLPVTTGPPQSPPRIHSRANSPQRNDAAHGDGVEDWQESQN